MRRWVRIRYGLTFQKPDDIIKYVKGLSKQDPKNRQAALAIVLSWINLQLGNTMNTFAKDENASEKSATELENMILYLAAGWSKNILDFSERGLPAAEGQAIPPAPTPQAAPAVAQGVKRIKATYAAKKAPSKAYCDLKRQV